VQATATPTETPSTEGREEQNGRKHTCTTASKYPGNRRTRELLRVCVCVRDLDFTPSVVRVRERRVTPLDARRTTHMMGGYAIAYYSSRYFFFCCATFPNPCKRLLLNIIPFHRGRPVTCAERALQLRLFPLSIMCGTTLTNNAHFRFHFFEHNSRRPVVGAERALQQILEKIELRAKWLQRDAAGVKAYVDAKAWTQ
jgi:hypothetical protein